MAPGWLGSLLNWPFRCIGQRSLPETHGVFEAELQRPTEAELLRDEFGVPHIFAATEHDLFFLNGVVHAQDRLWQMHSGRMLASGRLCEMVGSKALDLDRFLRQLGLRQLAEEDAQHLRDCGLPDSAEALRMMEAYAEGVNWYAFRCVKRKRLPLEFTLTGQSWEEWTPVHSLALIRFWGFAMNYGFQHALLRRSLAELLGKDLAELWTNTKEEEASIPFTVDRAAWEAFKKVDLSAIPKIPKGDGSNWWAVHGKHTSTGKPLLVGDPHLSIRIPNFWYEIHGTLRDSQPFALHGVAPPGIPATLIGQNGKFANSITLAYCDVEDVFLERVKDGKYLHKGEWHRCNLRSEIIKVKNSESQECLCRSTCHGPLLEGQVLGKHEDFKTAMLEQVKKEEDEEVFIAYAAIALRPKSLSALSLWKILRTDSFAKFDAALSHLSRSFSLNFGYADVDGHIGYVMTGEVPKRGKPGVEQYPLPGWTGEHDWQTFVAHQDLPKAFDPPDGYLISANHKVVDYDYYKHYLGQCWKSGYRARAIKEKLQQIISEGRVLPEQMPKLVSNTVSWAAIDFVAELRSVRPTAETEEAYRMLLDWDGDLRPDSVAGALYQLTFAELVQLLIRAGLTVSSQDEARSRRIIEAIGGSSFDENQVLKFLSEIQGHVHLNVLRMLRGSSGTAQWLAMAGGRDAAVNTALRSAWEKLGDPKSETAQWGHLHKASFKHPLTKALGLPPGSKPFDCHLVPTGGDTNTIQQAATTSIFDLSANSSHASLRICFNLADLNDGNTNRIIMPLGQSGHFVSKH